MSYASDTFLHYIKILWEQTDLSWNDDNESEVESIIESVEAKIKTEIDKAIKEKLCTEEQRQKIASEQLAAVVIADAAVWAKDANAWMSPDAMVKKAVGLADLLLKELQDSTD